MNFIDLFAGLGGFRLGMEEAGHKCVGFCEIDKFARITYKANFDTDGEWEAHDITSVTNDDIRELGRTQPIDIICGGFPCQAFSIAGKRRGFDDTRGTLFFEILRFARLLKPKYLFLENVKGLLNHEQGRTFEVILQTLDELGYDAEWQLLNSKNFGVPQNRERVYIIGHLRGTGGRKIFPIGSTNDKAVKQIIGGSQGNRVYDVRGLSVTLSSQGGGGGAKTGLYLMDLSETNPKITDTARTLQARYNKGIANTLTCGLNQGTLSNMRIRKLTPLECFRLQSYPDTHWKRAKEAGVSDSQLYKQAGNGVTKNVVYEIAKMF